MYRVRGLFQRLPGQSVNPQSGWSGPETSRSERGVMNISSLIVHVRPELLKDLRGEMSVLPGVEVHGASDDGRLVITVEDTDESTVADTVIGVHNLKGVLSAAMVYHFCDDALNTHGESNEAYQA
jgi:nitrate reductase NapD